ncbi:hypothetical protein POTOM_056934 [Populus tomentosa]|uniref:Uncharacterized protein n=1 Tax=Populus tomentosa TaxID=118781 RepID=A0A8X8C3F6_POPTO|nr:hypothetical protein POTOM_056934 [Populus tomentosa]
MGFYEERTFSMKSFMSVEFFLAATRTDSIPTKPPNIVNGFGTSFLMLYGKISFIYKILRIRAPPLTRAKVNLIENKLVQIDATREGLGVEGLNMAAVGEENTSSNVSSSAKRGAQSRGGQLLLKEVVLQKGKQKEIVPSTAGHKDLVFPSSTSIVFSAGSRGKAPFGKSGSICHEPKGWSLREDVHSVEVYDMTRGTKDSHHDPGISHVAGKGQPVIVESNGAMAMQMDGGP